MEHAPCMRCEERKELCHKDCKRYLEWKQKGEAVKKERVRTADIEGYRRKAVRRMAKARKFEKFYKKD